jgi:hypothetical protein
VAIGKLIPCLIPYKSIIYLKIFYQEKASFDQIKSCRFKNSGLIAKWHCSPGLGPVHSFPGRPMHSRAAHVHRPLPCFHMAPDTARPVPLSAAPAQLLGRRAPISFLRVAPSAPDPPSSILLSTRRPRADPPVFHSVSVQKPLRAPFHRFPLPRASLASGSPLPLPLTPPWPSAHFSVSDSTAPHRKLPRSHRNPISSVGSAARPPLAKMDVPHRALSLSGLQEPGRIAIGLREASVPPETRRVTAAPPPQ